MVLTENISDKNWTESCIKNYFKIHNFLNSCQSYNNTKFSFTYVLSIELISNKKEETPQPIWHYSTYLRAFDATVSLTTSLGNARFLRFSGGLETNVTGLIWSTLGGFWKSNGSNLQSSDANESTSDLDLDLELVVGSAILFFLVCLSIFLR